MALIFLRRYRIIRQCLQPSGLLLTQRSLSNLLNVSDFRTDEKNPRNHKLSDVGKFYTIPSEVAIDQMFKYGGWPKQFMEQCKTFHESCLMIRQPGLEVIHYLENADYTEPVHKYLFYGRHGNGKSLMLSYVIHYALLNGWLLVHLPWFPKWLVAAKDMSVSNTKEGFVDINSKATEWLAHFKSQNSKILNENELPVENDYVWNIRESSKAGDRLLSLVDYGISRGSFSSEVVIAILNEIKQLSRSGKVKTLLAIDGFNAFFHSGIKMKNGQFVPARKVSILNAFFEMTIADWHNGAVVLTTDGLAVRGMSVKLLPLDQMTLEGFEHIFPFIPIEVSQFTDTEFYNMLKYYKDRRWLREEGGDEELKYLSCQNGYELMRICAPL